MAYVLEAEGVLGLLLIKLDLDKVTPAELRKFRDIINRENSNIIADIAGKSLYSAVEFNAVLFEYDDTSGTEVFSVIKNELYYYYKNNTHSFDHNFLPKISPAEKSSVERALKKFSQEVLQKDH